MRHDSTSSAWPIAGVVLAALFVAGSVYLFFDVRGLRSALEASVGNAEMFTDLEEDIDLLVRAVDPAMVKSSYTSPQDYFAKTRTTVESHLAAIAALSPPPVDSQALLLKLRGLLEELAADHAAFLAALPAGSGPAAGAADAYRARAEQMELATRDLITEQHRRSIDLSVRLSRRWTATHALHLLSCVVAAMSAWLLWRNQHHAQRQRETQRRLEEAENHLGTIVANAPVTVWATNADGIVTLSEGAALASIGLLPGQIVGQSVFEIYRDRPEIVDAHRRALAGETVDYRAEFEGVVFQALLIPTRGHGGAVIGASGVANDVTAREHAVREARLADVQRAEMQKAEALARIAGGVAHEFSNLLTVVTGFASLLRSNPDLSERDIDDVRQILKASGRAAELTQQLLAFSRRQRTEPRLVDLNSIVLDAQKMLETLLGSHVEVRVLHSSGPLAVRVDPGQFQQVLLNLGLNARDAMPDGGTFTLALSEVESADVPGELLLERGSYACLSVSDSGTGMDDETRSRVFEPFFTTKGPTQGTGLGLPTVQGILRQADGDVAIESTPKRGTTFRLYLPRRDPATIDVDTDTKELRLDEGREAILLVEDEPMVRAFTSRVLRRAGYEVLEAADGKSALEITRAFERRIALLVSDVVMPGLGGRELSKRFLEIRPGTPVLFLSGYAHEDDKLEYLQKPFSPQDLCRLVRARIDADDVTSARGSA